MYSYKNNNKIEWIDKDFVCVLPLKYRDWSVIDGRKPLYEDNGVQEKTIEERNRDSEAIKVHIQEEKSVVSKNAFFTLPKN
jgi:hypothetical protein